MTDRFEGTSVLGFLNRSTGTVHLFHNCITLPRTVRDTLETGFFTIGQGGATMICSECIARRTADLARVSHSIYESSKKEGNK